MKKAVINTVKKKIQKIAANDIVFFLPEEEDFAGVFLAVFLTAMF